MDYEITGTTTEPDEQGMLQVDYRTADGTERSVRYSAGDRTPQEVVEHRIERDEEEAAAANEPPCSFAMYVNLDMTDRTMDEVRQAYRAFAKSRGYEVDADMRPYKPAECQ